MRKVADECKSCRWFWQAVCREIRWLDDDEVEISLQPCLSCFPNKYESEINVEK